MDEGDSKGHNNGLGFEFEYTVKNRDYNCRRSTGGRNVEGNSTEG